MRKYITALLATAAIAAIAGPAAAAGVPPFVTLSALGDPNTLPADQQLVADFNDAQNSEAVLLAGFDLTLTGATVGVQEGGSGYSGTLPNDPTHYLTIPGNATASLTSIKGIKSFSFYMGSADTYNSIRFIGDNGYDVTLNGGQFTDGYTGQSWDWGTRVNFSFGDALVKQVVLTSGSNSFEVDNFAVGGGVPEPATWALMIMGFGAMGMALRSRRNSLSLA